MKENLDKSKHHKLMRIIFLTIVICFLFEFSAKSQLSNYQILPSATDVNINTFTAADQKHVVFLDKSATRKNQLL